MFADSLPLQIAGRAWNQLSEDDKRPFKQQALRIAADHQQRYPNYRYNPLSAAGTARKRNYARPAYAGEEQFLMLAMACVITEALAVPRLGL